MKQNLQYSTEEHMYITKDVDFILFDANSTLLPDCFKLPIYKGHIHWTGLNIKGITLHEKVTNEICAKKDENELLN